MTDQPSAIRPGEELDIPRLQAYLLDHLPGARGSLEVLQFPRGFSNLTYLLRLGEQELVLRRPPFGAQIKTAHDMGREFRILSALRPVYPKVPRPLLYCADESVLGAPFYVMERLHGVILRTQPLEGMTPSLMRGVCEAALNAMVELHSLDYQKAGLADLGKPEGYVERQVRGWTERYQKARTEEIPGMEQAMAWLAAHIPPATGAALIHNDFKYDNLILDPSNLTRVLAVLDWEMATLGDPLMDLGTTLGYWAEEDDPPGLKSFGLTHLPGNLRRAELVELYAARTGRDVSHMLFYYVFGLFKVGVIMQQIFFRYQKGLTQDGRFGMLIHLIREMGQKIQRAIETGKI
ncbi:MAG: phosphotransferase family protein [Meiothermus sp.]|uniref:phosphotransferase family protein n=1 Tax=Meiothermus sp. TaxID=1955249 RepID=UPI0025DB570E|nr:phosphotransferase family protein [Meiothermus sp.]MCS7069629.1 phosphotransferase family protein [Meiothermus sp.]MDW8426502.1 phosphotransferase family protein [Meiothermus sp.]